VAQDKAIRYPRNIWASRTGLPKTPRTATDECRSHYVGEDRVLLRHSVTAEFSLSITVRGRVPVALVRLSATDTVPRATERGERMSWNKIMALLQ